MVVTYMPFGETPEIELFNFLGVRCSLTHAINTGAAWGAFGGFPDLLIVVRLVLISALILYMIFRPVAPLFRFPLLLIVAGAIGNVFDYFLYGHVIDMIHFVFWGYDYPVFNVADSMIFVGTFTILALSFTHDHQENA